MPTREELHKLVDSLPEAAVDPAHTMLSRMQVWPPPPPPSVEEMRKRMEERLEMRQGQKPGTLAGSVGGGRYDPTKGSGSSSFNYWDGDTYVQETLRHHKGHELKVIEQLRVDEKRLIYKHEVTGPGDKRDEREIVFDIPTAWLVRCRRPIRGLSPPLAGDS